ncbi:zinc transporter ZIP3-like isoform X2 [Saccostrea echinata]|uniref:zinc transporter ZIP3-like isoform X2 n=2 Tax=Saccostrea echinata TaxID=191078 RepID=UPI002A820123|nr:zinc transporter ZIP3-like isoform X2 [Saccostrea echinata]
MKSTAKIISIFVLFVTTFIIGILPHGLLSLLERKFPKGNRLQQYISILNCFAGGVFFATAILHLVPESSELLKGVFTIEYPISGALSGAGFFLLLFIEHVIGTCKGDASHHFTMENTEIEVNNIELTKVTKSKDAGFTRDEETGGKSKNTQIPPDSDDKPEHQKNIVQKDSVLSKLRAFVLLLAFSFHMIFEGLALGLEQTESGVWSLLGILALHKCIVSFSVGLQLSESLQRTQPVILSLIAFSAVAPVGVAIGFLVTEYGDNARAQKIAAGVLQSLATGTFFYVTFFEILQKELTKGHNLYNVFSTFMGFLTLHIHEKTGMFRPKTCLVLRRCIFGGGLSAGYVMIRIMALSLDEENWIHEEIEKHQIQINAASVEVGDFSEKDLNDKVSEKLDDLFEQTMYRERINLFNKRLERSELIVAELFQHPEKGKGDAPHKTPEKEYLENLMERQCCLVSDIMRTLKECRKYQEELDEVKKENRDIQVENRQLLKELKEKQESRKKMHDQETQSLCEELDQQLQMISITRCILQGLVVGSGVHWAENQQLQELVLKLGEVLQI